MRTLLCLLIVAATSFAAETRPPNIIHIVADDIGYDDFGCYGAPKLKTPNVDRVAAEGVRLTNFYAPAAICTPTRAALMTGCYAQRVGLPKVLFPNDNYGLSDREITVAELLKGRGYATACIGKWHLGCQTQFLPTHHGFDVFLGIPYPNDHGPERKKSNSQKAPFPPIPLIQGDKPIEPADLKNLPDRIGDTAVQFITDNKDKPFFLHLANIETHTPWFVPDHCADKSAEGAFGDAMQCFDHLVGRITETLAKLNLEDNTLLIITSDNGPLWNRHPELEGIYGKYATVDTSRPHVLRGGKSNARYEGGTRVACVARWPGTIPAGKTSDELAAGFDLFTTFAALGGAKVPDDRIIDGKDILPVLRGDSGAKSPHEYFRYYNGWNLAAIRDAEGWKLTLAGETELYNVRTDPGETKNVAAEHPEIVKRLQGAADEARKDLGDALQKTDGANRRPPQVASAEEH